MDRFVGTWKPCMDKIDREQMNKFMAAMGMPTPLTEEKIQAYASVGPKVTENGTVWTIDNSPGGAMDSTTTYDMEGKTFTRKTQRGDLKGTFKMEDGKLSTELTVPSGMTFKAVILLSGDELIDTRSIGDVSATFVYKKE